ncbi:type III secretion system chaperone [Bremerella sp. JC770]|uniref:type III secretion system chaperone n=1 Tax=Bremerella sp. JC770 TaxID=3232137 RepID=UPI003458E582
MHHEQFLTELRNRLDVPSLEFNREMVCRLLVDNEFVVDLEWDDTAKRLYLYSVASSSARQLKEQYFELLAANHFCLSRGDAVVSIDVERDEVLLVHTLETPAIDMDSFMNLLGRFIERIGVWKTMLLQSVHATPADQSSPTDSGSGDFIRV